MKHKVNEWQELSLKKDIEKIRKVISRKQEVNNAIMFDLLIAVIAILIDKFISPEEGNVKTWLFWTLFSICIIPFVIIFLKQIYKKIQAKNKQYNSHNPSDLIDSFDNDICYYVMMADSYNQMLNEVITQPNCNKNVASFYYIETYYYINKAKYKLYQMMYKTKNVFSDNVDVVIKKNLVAIDRLVNIIMIIEDVRVNSNALIQNKSIVLSDTSMPNMNKKYDKYYEDFISEINSNFNNILTIDFKDEKRFL